MKEESPDHKLKVCTRIKGASSRDASPYRMGITEMLRKFQADLIRNRYAYRQGKFKEAMNALENLIDCEEQIRFRTESEGKGEEECDLIFASAWSMLGRVYSEFEQDERSQGAISTSVAVFDPLWSTLKDRTGYNYEDYGASLYMIGRKGDAYSIFLEAANSGVATSTSYCFLGKLFLESCQKRNFILIFDKTSSINPCEKAEEFFRKSLKLDPYDATAFKGLAETLEFQGRISDAIDAYHESAISLEQANKLSKGINVLEHALELDPSNTRLLILQGRLLEASGCHNEALQAINQALALSPNDANNLEIIGEILLKLGLKEKSASVLKEVSRLNSRSVYGRLLLANALNSMKQYKEAIIVIDELLELGPKNPFRFALIQKAKSLRSMERFDEAKEELNRCIELSPNFSPAHIELAGILYDQGLKYDDQDLIDEALKEIKTASEKDPENALAYEVKGKILLAKGLIGESIENFRRSLEMDPNSIQTCDNLINVLRHRGRNKDNEEALAELNRILDWYPDDISHLISKGEVLTDLERPEEVIRIVNKILELQPENAVALELKGRALQGLGKAEESANLLQHALELNSKSATAYILLSNALISLKHYEVALNATNSALELNSELPSAWKNKGIALKQLGRYKEAIESFDRTFSLDNNVESLWNKGEAQRLMGENEEARITLNKAWSMAQRMDVSDEVKIKVLKSKANNERFLDLQDDARKTIEEAIRLDPKNPSLLTDQALIFQSEGGFLKALDKLHEAINLNDKYAEAWLIQSWLQLDMAKYKEAMISIKKATKLDPENEWNYVICGWIHWYSRRYHNSKTIIEQKALKINPMNPWALYIYANILRREEKMGDANAKFREVISILEKVREKNAFILWFLGMCYYHLRDYDRALGLLFDAKSLRPDIKYNSSIILRIRFNLALVLMASERPEQAKKEYKMALSIASTKKALEYLGPVFEARLDLADAIKDKTKKLAKSKEVEDVQNSLMETFKEIESRNELKLLEKSAERFSF